MTSTRSGPPQETTENSVDFDHFTIVHGYRNLRVIHEARTEGPYLTARCGRIGVALDTESELHVHGLDNSHAVATPLFPRALIE